MLKAPVGEAAVCLYNPDLSVDVCNIYCSGLENQVKPHWEEIFNFSVTPARGLSTRPHLSWIPMRRTLLEHLINLAALLLLRNLLPLQGPSSHCQPPFPDFLTTQFRLKVLFTKHSLYLLSANLAFFSPSDSKLPSQAYISSLYHFKVNLGPQTQELIVWPVGWNKAVKHCRSCCHVSSANSPCLFFFFFLKKPLVLVLNLFSLLFTFDVHFKNNKNAQSWTVEQACLTY